MNDNVFPAIMSFLIPGVGQMMKGDTEKGLWILIFYCISLVACFVIIGFFTTQVLYIWQLVDAYAAPRKTPVV